LLLRRRWTRGADYTAFAGPRYQRRGVKNSSLGWPETWGHCSRVTLAHNGAACGGPGGSTVAETPRLGDRRWRPI